MTVRCPCTVKDGQIHTLCRMHGAYFRQLRSLELAAAGAEPPARKRRPGTTPTTDAIATIAAGAGLGVMWWMSPDGALWPYLVAPAAMFLLVVGVLNLVFDRKARRGV